MLNGLKFGLSDGRAPYAGCGVAGLDDAHLVQLVLRDSDPFEVLSAIVRFVAVDMVHVSAASISRKERQCNKPMHEEILASDQNLKVPAGVWLRLPLAGRRESHSAPELPHAAEKANAPIAGHFVPRVVLNLLPIDHARDCMQGLQIAQ